MRWRAASLPITSASALHSAGTSPVGRTSTPSLPSRTISRGPVSQSNDTAAKPLAIDSSKVLDSPSKRDVST
ncbi:hypothetical protein G6F65_020717 [Rhizopus arrhizus]|nr:hypothetical protein G6F65_020717 [Rhizopus arrhizus]